MARLKLLANDGRAGCLLLYGNQSRKYHILTAKRWTLERLAKINCRRHPCVSLSLCVSVCAVSTLLLWLTNEWNCKSISSSNENTKKKYYVCVYFIRCYFDEHPLLLWDGRCVSRDRWKQSGKIRGNSSSSSDVWSYPAVLCTKANSLKPFPIHWRSTSTL